jgi:hypothetical protein
LRFFWVALFCENASRQILKTRETDPIRRRYAPSDARPAAAKR